MSAEAFASEEAGAQIGRYKLLEQIGEGGMGTIWMAEQREPVKRRVALKIIKLGMDTKQVIARFEAERQALAMMDHPHIAKVFDAGATERGRPYFVMEYIKGIPILEYCDQERLDTRARLELFVDVCHAIQHAHQKGIIHRDIKPSNVLVTLHDGVPVPKVIDFGIAKATNGELTARTLFTEHRQIIGTPAYMSPEQAEMSGLDIDTRSDVYSLGVLLYELLTGTTPFDTRALLSSGYNEMLRAIREDEPHKPSTRVSSLGDTGTRTALQRRVDVKKLSTLLRGDIDWIVMKCLEKNRTRRYETANGLAADVRRHLASEAVLAAPPSTSYRLRKFVRRNRTQVATAGLVTVALLLGLAGTAWQAKRASARAVAAKEAEREAKIARDAEKARADELEQVSNFQEAMLAQVDVTTVGARLTEDVNRRFAAALEKADVPEAERGGLADRFRRDWERVNAVDAAAGVIDTAILKPAVSAIDDQFGDQPIVASRLRQALADGYTKLGLHDAAFPLQQSALATFRSALGEEHVETLHSIGQMGVLLWCMGEFAESETYACEALEKSRRVLGDEHLATLQFLGYLGLQLHQQGKLDEAEPYYSEALETSRRVLGDEHVQTLASLNNMAGLLQSRGEFARAEPYFREALEKSRRVLGEEHRHTVVALNNLGLVLQVQDKLAEAEPYLREALETSRRVLGEEHPDTLRAIDVMGQAFSAQGKLAAGEPYYREALEKRRRVLGEEHPDTLASFYTLAASLQAQGRSGEAERLLAEGVEAARRGSMSEYPITAELLHHHADALRALGRLDEAEAQAREAMQMYRDHPVWSAIEASHTASILATILTARGRPDEALAARREWLAAERRRLPSGSAELNGPLALLGLALLEHGTLEAVREAEPLLRECLEIRVATMPDDWRVPNTRSMLGGAILAGAELDPALTPADRAARLREAEPLLLEGHAGLVDHPAVPAPEQIGGADRRREALERIVRLYEVWDEVEPGAGHASTAMEWRAKLPGPPTGADER